MFRTLEPALRYGMVALLALMLALPGCGPGTGGTGTGPIALSFSSAGGGSITAPPFSPPPSCADTACDRVDLRLEEERVELTAACARFLHEGGWAVDDAGLLMLQGTWEAPADAGTARVPATLRLQFTERDLARANVEVLLLDVGGGALLGPLALQGQGAAPPAAACAAR